MAARIWDVDLKIKTLIVFILILPILYFLFSASPTQAACYCQNPGADKCRCSGPPPASAKNEASVGGIAVVCDTPAEADSVFATKAPICGSSPEIVPACAPNKALPSEYTCYGAQFATGARSIPEEAFSTLTRVDGITFNGVDYPDARSVLACNSIAFCCARSDIICDDTKVPSTPSSCTPQNESVTPPVEICGVVGGPASSTPPNAQTDSRIYFPHVKNTSSITYLLQSMFRPISWAVQEIKDNIVYSKVFEHQGISDNTKVVNKTTNNSSLVPNQTAPPELFTFKHPPDESIPKDGSCLISDVRINPGDDLLGKKVYANLQYTQKFEYTIDPKCVSGGCVPDYIYLPTKGKSLVYTKSPFLEYLYQNLVAGPAGIYRRFVAKDIGEEIKDIPTQATIAVDSLPGKVVVADTKTQTTSDIYFPHVGSIYDYFLKNLQKLLRPKGVAGAATVATPSPPTTLSGGSCTIFYPEKIDATAAAAGNKYGVPDSFLKAIFEIEALPYITGRQDYTCDESSSGPEGLMQIDLATYNSVTCSGERSAGVCQDSSPGVLSRCNTTGAFELAARVALIKAGLWDSSNCTSTGPLLASDKIAIYNAANNYYGSCQPDSLTRQYSYNLPNPPRSNMNYGDIVCNKMGLCPSYIVPQCSGLSPTGQTLSEYCQANPNGVFRSPDKCVNCASLATIPCPQ